MLPLTTSSFNDVDPSAWYAPAVEWAFNQGIVMGIGEDNFAPNAPITREQMAVMLYRYMNINNIELPPSSNNIITANNNDVATSNNDITTAFADQDNISYWAIDAVVALQAAGIITGRPNNNFDPLDIVIRAEVAAVFVRVVGE